MRPTSTSTRIVRFTDDPSPEKKRLTEKEKSGPTPERKAATRARSDEGGTSRVSRYRKNATKETKEAKARARARDAQPSDLVPTRKKRVQADETVQPIPEKRHPVRTNARERIRKQEPEPAKRSGESAQVVLGNLIKELEPPEPALLLLSPDSEQIIDGPVLHEPDGRPQPQGPGYARGPKANPPKITLRQPGHADRYRSLPDDPAPPRLPDKATAENLPADKEKNAKAKPKTKLTRFVSTKKLPSKQKPEAEEVIPSLTLKPLKKPGPVALFRRKKEKPTIENARTVEPTRPDRPFNAGVTKQQLRKIPGIALPGDNAKAYYEETTKTCNYMLTILTDDAYASIRSHFRDSMKKQWAEEYVELVLCMNNFSHAFSDRLDSYGALQAITGVLTALLPALNLSQALQSRVRTLLSDGDVRGLQELITNEVYVTLSGSVQEPYFKFMEQYRDAPDNDDISATFEISAEEPKLPEPDGDSFAIIQLFQNVLNGVYGTGSAQALRNFMHSKAFVGENANFLDALSQLSVEEPFTLEMADEFMRRFITPLAFLPEGAKRAEIYEAQKDMLNLSAREHIELAKDLLSSPTPENLERFKRLLQYDIATHIGASLRNVYIRFLDDQRRDTL